MSFLLHKHDCYALWYLNNYANAICGLKKFFFSKTMQNLSYSSQEVSKKCLLKKPGVKLLGGNCTPDLSYTLSPPTAMLPVIGRNRNAEVVSRIRINCFMSQFSCNSCSQVTYGSRSFLIFYIVFLSYCKPKQLYSLHFG